MTMSPENCSILMERVISAPNMTFSIADYLACAFGPPSMNSALLLTIVYSILFCAGVSGNVATVISIARNARFHTPTNYYLVSLAASDVLILVLGISEEMYRFWNQYPWPFGLWFCRMRNMASETFLYISILTIMAFTCERYFAIVHPLLSRKLMTSRTSRIYKVIASIWIISLINAIPYGVYSEINYLPYPGNPKKLIQESAWCGLPWEHPVVRRWLEYSFSVFFVLPMVLLVFLYSQIAVTLSRGQTFIKQQPKKSPTNNGSTGILLASQLQNTVSMGSDGSKQNARQLNSRTSAIKMLVGIVLCFFICFSVFHAQRLLTIYVEWQTASDFLKNLYTNLHLISGTLYYLNPTMNPILYALHTRKFQNVITACFCRCGLTGPHRTLSQISNSRVTAGSRITTGGTSNRKNSRQERNQKSEDVVGV